MENLRLKIESYIQMLPMVVFESAKNTAIIKKHIYGAPNNSFIINDDIEYTMRKLGVDIETMSEEREVESCGYYCMANDHVRLRKPQSYATTNVYYFTMIHEVVHWTARRLSREVVMLDIFDKMFGVAPPAYWNEEFVANMTTLLVAGHFGILTDDVMEFATALMRDAFYRNGEKIEQGFVIKESIKSYKFITNA